MINTDVTYRGEDVDVIDGEVAVILADQVIQDKRILELEMDSDGISNIFQHSLLENNISFLKCLILVKMMCVSFVDLLESVTSLQAAADELSTAVARVEDRVMNLNSTLIDVDGRVVDLNMTLTEVESRVEETKLGLPN